MTGSKKSQHQLCYGAERKISDATQAFLALCHPARFGMSGSEPMTLAEYNVNAARRPEVWEKFRVYAERNLL